MIANTMLKHQDVYGNLIRLTMKVILLQDVAKIGKRFSIAEVPDGYALNQLIPKKMAEPATPANLKKIERFQAESVATKEADQTRFEAAKEALSDKKIVVVADANEKGHLFKAVHESEIADAAVASGISVDSSMLSIQAPIKELGEHTVDLVSQGVAVSFTVEIVKK